MKDLTIKYRHRKMKRWDENYTCKNEEEFNKRIAEDIAHGHKAVETENGLYCYIGFK